MLAGEIAAGVNDGIELKSQCGFLFGRKGFAQIGQDNFWIDWAGDCFLKVPAKAAVVDVGEEVAGKVEGDFEFAGFRDTISHDEGGEKLEE